MNLKIILGLILIAINVPVGWGGAVLFGYRAKKTKQKKYIFLSGFTYAFSWIILLAGIWLCGDAYKEYISDPWFKYGAPAAIIIICAAALLLKKYLKKKSKKTADKTI